MSNAVRLPGNVPAGSISAAELDGTFPAGSVDPSELSYTIRVPLAFPGSWDATGDAKGGALAGLDETLDLTATEQGASLVKVYDHGTTTFANKAEGGMTGWTGSDQLTADAGNEQINDAVYFGGLTLGQLWLDIDTVATYDNDAFVWEYWNGTTWATLTIIYDATDTDDQDGDRPFQGDGVVVFAPPTNWAKCAVAGTTNWWIRARVTAAAITQTPVMSSSHYVCTPAAGPTMPFACTITAVRLADSSATAHTTADVKFVLLNTTKGTYSNEMTFAMDRRTQRFALSTTIDCDAGDAMAVLVTQDDNGADPSDVVLELDVTPG